MHDEITRAYNAKLLSAAAARHLSDWLRGRFLPTWAQDSINQLVEADAWEELNDRFFRTIAFGTGGMRGRTIGRISTLAELGRVSGRGTPEHPAVGSAFLNDFNVVRATVGLHRYCLQVLTGEGAKATVPRIVIAHDVRHFSRHFCELTAATWMGLGGIAQIFDGPRSTPQLSFTVRSLGATAGIVITASHNPPHDNGYKVYFRDGGQVVEPHAGGIIGMVKSVRWEEIRPFLEFDPEGAGAISADVETAYQEAVSENVLDPDVLRTSGLKVVFTPIHGTGGVVSLPLMHSHGVEVATVPEQEIMDPRFPSVLSPNPENPEALAMAVSEADRTGADLVVGTDPDADRMGVAVRDGDGRLMFLTGNTVGALLAEYRISRLKAMGILPQDGSLRAVLIKTFVTTPLQEAIGTHHGMKVINTLTGFKYIGEKLLDYENDLVRTIRENEGLELDYAAMNFRRRAELHLKYGTFYVFGGEESCGYLASDRVRDKDANAAAIMMCELVAALKSQGRTVADYVDEIYCRYGYFSEELLSLVYDGEDGADRIERILSTYRLDPPQKIGDCRVSGCTDFGTEVVHDADGKEIPKQDFYFLEMENGYGYAVRGSGTEPKIKFYLFGREAVSGKSELVAVRSKVERNLNDLKERIEADARIRAEPPG